MPHAMIVQSLAVVILSFSGMSAVADELSRVIASVSPPERFADHQPHFTVARETFTFTEGNDREQTFYVIRDHDRCIAVLHDRMWQLDMISFDPTRTTEPGQPPRFASFYSWGTLLGIRLTAATWYPDMYPSGRVVAEFSEPGPTLTITTTQTWPQPRDARSTYVMTLRCDPVLGYVWDLTTDFSIREPARNAKGEMIRPEIFNWQVRVTGWTQRHNQRWPAAWDHQRTIFHDRHGKTVGFYLNPDANDRSRFRRSEVAQGGYVAKLPGPHDWGVALVHLDKAGFSTPNATCNMWGDQHNYLKLPDAPDTDGLRRAAATWRWQAIPPEAVNRILDRAEMDTTGHGH